MFTFPITETYRIWSSLLNNDQLQLYHQAIAQRAEEAMQPFHYLAAATDPETLSEEPDIVPPLDNAILDDWLSDNYPEFIAPYMAFKIRDPDYFDPHMFRDEILKNFSGFKWWSYIKLRLNEKRSHSTEVFMLDHMIEFCAFLCKLHSIPGSNAGLERIFSKFSYVWTKLRNRLGPEKVDKLVKIHKRLNE